MQRRLTGFDIRKEVVEVIQTTDQDIIALNREQMNSYGIDKTGADIVPYYTPLTIRIKTEKGQETSFVTLRDTGAFQNAMVVEVNQASGLYFIDSTDSKVDDLEKKYGENIFGLTPESRGEYIQNSFFPALKALIEQRLGFKFS